MVLISIRPCFAQAILDGTKTVELRRQRLLAAPGSLALLYSSSPVKAIVGTARIDRIEQSSPLGLWMRVGDSAGVTRAQYDAYFEGSPRAVALHLCEVRRLEPPAPLAELRSTIGVEPAQSFRYLTLAQLRALDLAADAVA